MQHPSTSDNGSFSPAFDCTSIFDTADPLIIRGVTPSDAPSALHLQHSLDWLTYTVPFEVGWQNAFPASDILCPTGEVLSNIKGYDNRIALTHGSVSWHSRYSHHKICVQFGGRDLRRLVEAGVDPKTLLTYVLEHDGKVTRLDFALDVFGPSSPKELHDAWEAAALRTPARSCQFMLQSERTKGEIEKTYSTYIGSKTSERRIRCYDKAWQMKVAGPWTRIEFIARDDAGNRLSQAMVETDIGSAGKQAIRDFVQCDIDWFNQAVTGSSVYIAPSSRQEHDTRHWLMKTVLPVLCRIVDEDMGVGEVTIREAFLDALLRRTLR